MTSEPYIELRKECRFFRHKVIANQTICTGTCIAFNNIKIVLKPNLVKLILQHIEPFVTKKKSIFRNINSDSFVHLRNFDDNI